MMHDHSPPPEYSLVTKLQARAYKLVKSDDVVGAVVVVSLCLFGSGLLVALILTSDHARAIFLAVTIVLSALALWIKLIRMLIFSMASRYHAKAKLMREAGYRDEYPL